MTRLEPLMSHKVFRWASGINALIALAMGVLGSMIQQPGVRGVHEITAMVFLVSSLLAGLSGMRYGKESNSKGLAPHGLGLFVLAIVQYGLGEMNQPLIHMFLGLLVVIGALALFAMATRQPMVVTEIDEEIPTQRSDDPTL